MPFRELLLNLAITFVLVLIITLVAILLRKENRAVPAAIPIAKATATAPAVTNSSIPPPKAEFEVFPKAKFIVSKNNEGDTLRIKPDDFHEEAVFSLYFVDAAENSLTHPQRVQEQARYFDASQEGVLKTGAEATAYVSELLKDRPFVLMTRWEPVPDRSRYYALILVQNGNEKSYLADLLMMRGYARLGTVTCDLPGGVQGADDYGRYLLNLGIAARETNRGAFGRK